MPESEPVEDLIKEMRRQRIKMAIVLDERWSEATSLTLDDESTWLFLPLRAGTG